MVHKPKDYKSLLLFSFSFWTLVSIGGMKGLFQVFDIAPVWFVLLFFLSFAPVALLARRVSIRVNAISMIGAVILFTLTLPLVFYHNFLNAYDDYFQTSETHIPSEYEQKPPLRQEVVVHDREVGQLYATCLFGDRQTMIDKMKKRDAFTWFAYSKFGSPQDIFGGFEEGTRTKKSCEDLLDLAVLEHQEVGCTGLLELCEISKSDRCEVRKRQCRVVLSSPFE